MKKIVTLLAVGAVATGVGLLNEFAVGVIVIGDGARVGVYELGLTSVGVVGDLVAAAVAIDLLNLSVAGIAVLDDASGVGNL